MSGSASAARPPRKKAPRSVAPRTVASSRSRSDATKSDAAKAGAPTGSVPKGSVKVAVRRLRAATASLDVIETEFERTSKANRSLSTRLDTLAAERDTLARNLKSSDQRIAELEKNLRELSTRVDNALKFLHDFQQDTK